MSEGMTGIDNKTGATGPVSEGSAVPPAMSILTDGF